MATNQTPTNSDALLSLIERVRENYQEPPPSPPKRGKKRDFSALSFLLLAVVAVTMRTFRDSELRKLLEKDQRLRQALGFERVPHRTSIGRRLCGLVAEAEQQIALLGQRIVEEVKPQAEQPQVSAIDGRMYKAQGPTWHKRDRELDLVPVGLRKRRYRVPVVQERLSRLGARLQASAARASLSGAGSDLCGLAREQ
jgi:hypothetical protein